MKKFRLYVHIGQLKLSGIVLIDLLNRSNTKIYYSGDIDPEGIIIADKVADKCKQIQFIGFDKESYLKNISNNTLTNSRLKMLDKVKSLKLKPICEILKEYKKASYEELNIENVIKKFI